MKISPVGINRNLCGNIAFKRAQSAVLTKNDYYEYSDNPNIATASIHNYSNLFINSESRIKQNINHKLTDLETTEISDKCRKRFKNEIQAMKKDIADMCVKHAGLVNDGFDYDKTAEYFSRYSAYVKEEKDYLSDIMNLPWDVAKKERVKISSYVQENPDDPRNEIFQSSVFKIHELIKMNRPSVGEFE